MTVCGSNKSVDGTPLFMAYVGNIFLASMSGGGGLGGLAVVLPNLPVENLAVCLGWPD